MAARSAGLLLFRRVAAGREVLLVHPGGPFWAKKDAGAWSIPKGEYDDGEDALAAARRECSEELGEAVAGLLTELSAQSFIALGEVRQKGGKVVTAFAVEADIDEGAIASNSFEIEWPPRSGKLKAFPEIDRAQWFEPDEALKKINASQADFIRRLPGYE